MRTLADSLHNEHKKIAQRLRLLENEVSNLKAGGEPDYELITLLVRYLTGFPAEFHHQQEDLVFEALTEKGGADVENLPNLPKEHNALAKQIEAFEKIMETVQMDQEIAIDTIADACARYVREQQAHMNMEEGAFLPLAQRLLTDKDWKRLDKKLSDAERDEALARKLAESARLDEQIDIQTSDKDLGEK